jgi:hypothetical protein
MMKNKLLKLILLGLGLLILLAAIAIRGSRSNQVIAANGYPAPNELLTATLSPCDQEKALNDSRPPNSKPIMSEEDYQQCVAALTAAPKTKVLKPTETPLPTRSYKENRLRRIAGNGILIEGLLGMYNPHSFVQTNAWYEKSGDRFIYVFGGVKKDPSPDRSHSAVTVIESDLAGNWLAEGGTYEAPVQAGELTIVDAKGEILTLTTPDGDILFFNVASRKFITPDPSMIASSDHRKAGNGVMVEKRDSPFSASYIVYNHWFQDNNGKRLTIFSGRTPGGAGQAVVLITSSQGDPTASDQPEVYTVPGYIASEWEYLRIFAVNQDIVILAGKRGGEYVFDLSSKRFLSPAEVAQLTVDPDLLALEASFQKIRAEASAASSSVATPITTTTPTVPAYP